MADNHVDSHANGGSAVQLASDDVSGVWYPIQKLAFGALDSVTLVSPANGLPVNIVAGGGGTQYTEDVAAAADPVGTVLNLVRRDTPSATEVSADGDNIAAKAASTGAQYVELLSGITKITGGGGTEATALRVTLASDSTGLVSVDDNAGSLTVDAPVGTPVNVQVGNATLSAGVVDETGVSAVDALAVGGGTPHDAVDSGNPQKIGGKANLNEPTAVASGDRVDAWFDLLGRLVTLPGHPNPEAPVTVNGSAAGVTVIAAPGASLSLYICKGVVTNAAAAENLISLRDGAAGTIRWTVNAAADGGGARFDFGPRGWKLTANTALVADIGAATGYVNVEEYYIAA